MKRLDGLKIAKQIAKERGGECLSIEYVNIRTYMTWKCSKGHIWETPLNAIKNQNQWCYYCAGSAKFTYEFVKSEIEKRNGKLLSKEYSNTHTKLKIKCSCGNIFYMRFNDIKYDHWCPECAKIKKATKRAHSYEYIKDQIEKRGGKLLSKTYKNKSEKLKVECSCGYIFYITFGNIRNGHWCPDCALGKSQRKLQSIIEKILQEPTEYNYRDLDWLRNPETNSKLEIDIWVPNLKLAIEYDGKQHFEPVRFGGVSQKRAEEMFVYAKGLDKTKNELIKNHSGEVNYFIRIPYTEELTTDNIKQILTENNILKEKSNANNV